MKSLSKKSLGVIGGLYLLLMIYITVTVVVVSPRMSFPCKTGVASKNLPMLAMAAVCFLAAVFAFQSREEFQPGIAEITDEEITCKGKRNA